jgi:glutathione peroxidase
VTSPRRRLPPRFGCTSVVAVLALSSFIPRASSAASDSSSDGTGRCAAPAMSAATSLKDLTGLKAIDGAAIPAGTFDGKVVLAVNVASACGYTASGYEMMREIGSSYDGVVVAAVPCNAFGRQESGSPAEIEKFAKERCADLVVTERSEVNGPSAHPIYALGLSKFPGKIGWNFDGVFLFDKEGVPAARFGNGASAREIRAAVEKLL